jgi:hypothetical protein
LADILVGLIFGDFDPGQVLISPEGIKFEVLDERVRILCDEHVYVYLWLKYKSITKNSESDDLT